MRARTQECVCVPLPNFQMKCRSVTAFKVGIEGTGVMHRKTKDVQRSTLIKY